MRLKKQLSNSFYKNKENYQLERFKIEKLSKNFGKKYGDIRNKTS
jgi:hypothetical protein